MPNIANLKEVATVNAGGSAVSEPFAAIWVRRHKAGLVEVPTFSAVGGLVSVANAALYARNLKTVFFDAKGGGSSDPVGPQRWPLKL